MPASIDRAMRAGYNWELGPFEMWDAVGVAPPSRMQEAARPRQPGTETGASRYSIPAAASTYPVLPAGPASQRIADFRNIARRRRRQSRRLAHRSGRRHRVHRAAFEEERDRRRHHPPDHQDTRARIDAVRDFQGFVISSDAPTFPSAQIFCKCCSSFRRGSGRMSTLPSAPFSG